MAYQTRDAVKWQIFGASKPLPENQIPTYLDVVKEFLYERPILKLERKNAKLPLREIAAEVAQKVEAIGKKVAYQQYHIRDGNRSGRPDGRVEILRPAGQAG